MSLLALLALTSHAGSISTAGIQSGPDSGAATVDPAAVLLNPAAIAPTEGFDLMLDAQATAVRVQGVTTRNGGIDPNTGEDYTVAEGGAIVPNAVLGATWNVVPKRLTLGLAVGQPFTGGGDYTKGENNPPPYTSHTRYAGITVRVITVQTHLAAGLTIVDGVHIGAGAGYVVDHISALQASDPLGTEGRPIGEGEPYSADSLLDASATGGHFAWNTGIFVNRFEKLQVGASFSGPGRFRGKGEGVVTLPELIQNENYTGPIKGEVTFDYPLPAIGRVWLASQISPVFKVGAGYEYQY